jgi:hypothetical protein
MPYLNRSRRVVRLGQHSYHVPRMEGSAGSSMLCRCIGGASRHSQPMERVLGVDARGLASNPSTSSRSVVGLARRAHATRPGVARRPRSHDDIW